MSPRTWTLRNALQIERRPELVALVGGGGKTSLMFALASELPGRRVVTTTTRIFAAQMKHAPVVLSGHDLSRLGTALATHGYCLVIGRVDGDKALGVEPDLPAQLLARPDVDYVIVEADGSRMRPVKVPAAHEPVMPLGDFSVGATGRHGRAGGTRRPGGPPAGTRPPVTPRQFAGSGDGTGTASRSAGRDDR